MSNELQYETSFVYISGSWYCRIPPSFVKHMKLQGDELTEGMIKTEVNKQKKPYCAIWKKGT